MADEDIDDIGTIRAFNRLYTSRLGLLDPRHGGSPFTLSEARILFEVAHRHQPTSAEISRALNIDRAQISRTVSRFVAQGLLKTREDPLHGRQMLLSLTPSGQAALAGLEESARSAVSDVLEGLPRVRRQRLLSATRTIATVFEATEPPTVILRAVRCGDLGLVAARQAMLYAQEYGWNQDFEAFLSRILADFHTAFDPSRDAAWIADVDAGMVGSAFLVRGDQPGTAKLRMLYVEPDARGEGVGAMLVAACIDRARALGYARIELWTHSILTAARNLYARTGFRLVNEVAHRAFGHDLVAETWSLSL